MTDYVTVAETDTLPRDGAIKLHGPAGFAGMRAAGRLAAEILEIGRASCRERVSPRV